jgi:putative membrane protein
MVLALVSLAAGGLLYGMRARTLAREGRPVPWRRIACFVTGLLLIATASTALDGVADDRLVAHMAEHLVMGDIAALLLVLGLTGPLLAPVLRIKAFDRLRVLTNPLVALPLWALNLYLWHVPFVHEAALRSEVVHAVQHGLFLFLGANVWMPLFGPLPKPAWFGTVGKLGYIVAVRLVGGLLANVLTWSGTIFFPLYGADLEDQGAAGLLMMVEGSLLTIALFAWLFLDAARQADRKQELLDWAAARGIELDERRAARAVAAHREEELRGRLEQLGHRDDDGEQHQHGDQDLEGVSLALEGVERHRT